MDTNWNNRNGGYLGQPPQRSPFGRKAAPLSDDRVESFTLAEAVQPALETHRASEAIINDIDFQIGGGDMQFVEIELDPGEAVVAEPGAMIWKDSAITFDTALGDGSNDNAGIGSKLVSAGRNLIAGESLFVAEFRHEGKLGKARVAFGGRVPGQIIPVRLDAMGGSLICQRHSFLAAAKGVEISTAFQRELGSAIFGGEDFVMQRLRGQGWVFLHIGGTIIERELAPGEVVHVDGGCIAAHEPQVEMNVDDGWSFRALKSSMLGGESLFLTSMRGPGKIWIQTLPFKRVASQVQAAVPEAGIGANGNGIGVGDLSARYGDAGGLCRPCQIEENVLQIGLARRDVGDAVTRSLHGAEHVTGIGDRFRISNR